MGDVLRKQLMGVEESTHLPPEAYAPEVTTRVYAQLADLAERVLAKGHAVIVDAVHAKHEERAAIEAVAERVGVCFEGLWLEAPTSVLESRIAARKSDASDATVEILRRQLGFVQRPGNWCVIDASGDVAKIALELGARSI